MHITELNRECLLHLFSFLDKESRRSLSLTCLLLREVFLDAALWPVLSFHSPCELKRDNFVLGSSLRYLSVCWHSSRVKVCNIEDWMKTTFQKDICRKHETLVSDFLSKVCNRASSLAIQLVEEVRTCVQSEKSIKEELPRWRRRNAGKDAKKRCPNLQSLTLSGCGHITDRDVARILQSCAGLRCLRLENCVRVTDEALRAVVAYGHSLQTVQVDFCRNLTRAGLQRIQDRRPSIHLSAERSADMIPDIRPEGKVPFGRTLQKLLQYS